MATNSLDQLVESSYQTLVKQIPQNQVILLHPNSRYRSIILAKLLNESEFKTLYYSVRADDITLKAFLDNFIKSISTQYEMFGRHLNILPQELFDDLEDNLQTVVSAFMRELREISSDDYVLIIDEFDRSDTVDHIQTFIESVIGQLPAQCHIILNARTAPRLPWLALVAENKASIILDDSIIADDFYEIKNEDAKKRLEIYGFGQGSISHGKDRISDWEGHLPRLLMFFVMDKPAVTRSEICKSFWPKLGLDQAVNVFHVTKRRLHKAIGVDILSHENNYYSTSHDLNIYYDVLHFVEMLVAGRASSGEERFDYYHKASELYTGAFLFGHDEAWIVRRRESFRVGYLEALTAMAENWVEKDNKELALGLYQEAINEDYHREDIHRNLMKLYSDLGRKGDAVTHYNRLADNYNTEKRQLSSETQDVYNEIMFD